VIEERLQNGARYTTIQSRADLLSMNCREKARAMILAEDNGRVWVEYPGCVQTAEQRASEGLV